MGIVADVQTYLQAAGIVDDSSSEPWPSVRRRVHDGSDRLVIITEDGGFEPETPAPPGTLGDSALKEPAVQVRIRGEQWDSDAAQAKAQEVFDALHGLMRVEINGTYYMRIKAQTAQPLFIGFDEKGRPEFTISFRAVTAVGLPTSV